MRKIIFIICDGIGDRPISSLNNQTPLENAKTPNMDELANKGITGLVQVVDKELYPGSDIAHMSLFGYDLEKYYCGRGPVEVVGIGMELEKGDVAWRCNLATVDSDLVIKDRRAGRISSTKEFVEEFDGTEIEGVRFLIKPSTAYRAVLVLRGGGLSGRVSENDPKAVGEKVLQFEPEDESKEAIFTARIMNEFLERAHNILKKNPLNEKRINEGKLPANYLLCRGAGYVKEIPSVMEKYGMKACCIAGAGLYKGIGRLLGMDLIEVEGASGLPDTDIKAKFLAAKEALKKYDFVFVHVKAADSLAEDGNAEGKRDFIERIDEAMTVLMGLKKEIIVITADHCTPCELKKHSSDPVPALIYFNGIKADSVKKFTEKDCRNGSVGLIKGNELMPKLLELAK